MKQKQLTVLTEGSRTKRFTAFWRLLLFVLLIAGQSGLAAVSTIWPSTAVPGTADGGPDSAVELGVKFQADAAGSITGIRFYKATANTGTHVGNLWTSAGTLLGSVTLTNETASGWQQMLFASPVTIASNTIYVASYHATGGHYSEDDNYFSTKGVDNPPLHALTNGVSGGNGVYAYGASSVFPNQTWSSANYWVDVVFQPAVVATLNSIAVTPTNTTILTGTGQQFTATGTYSDNSTQNLSSQVTWTSSKTAVATISSSGLATGISAGTTTISAALSGVTGSTVLTVQTAPLAITTTSLTGGTVGAAYSATLAASGGSLPYTWSITGGGLPAGLTLNAASGAITGTPTTAGVSNFTAQVSDASSPVQTATKALSITIAAVPTTVSIWPSTAVPGTADGGADSPVELGVKFRSDVAGSITGIRFYKASANTGTHVGNLWTSAGALAGSVTFSGETASGWQQMLFATPVAITPNTVYVASYHVTGGHYSEDQSYFSSKGVDNPPLHALTNGVSGGNGVYVYGASSTFPSQTYSSANYWVDVVFQAAAAPTLSSIAVTPTNATVVAGGTQQFTATGTYSDGSTSNVTSRGTWASSSTAVATINANGLATAVAAGTTTISAALTGVTNSTVFTVKALPTLSSISVTPTNATVVAGGTQQFTATGTYSDGSTSNVTSRAAWASSSTAVATINTNGLATAVAAGTTTISAALTGVTNSTVFTVKAPPTLSSIAVTPTNATVVAGGTQQFTATGTYSDGSTSNLTSRAAWASSSTAMATINANGLATAVAAGTTTISAALTGVTNGTLLTVQASPLSLTTATLSNGVVNVAYSATLAGSGGTLPYTWSIASGGLPAGLTLNAASGAITGTPTTAGVSNFTAQVSDASSPVQTATKALSITIAAVPTTVSIWPSTAVPGTADGGADSPVELGVKFQSDVAGSITGIRFYKASANTGTHVGNLWTSAGTLAGSVTFSGETASGWQQMLFATPVAITPNTVYVASYHVTGGHYSADLNYFLSNGVNNPPLHALTNGVSGGNGVYVYGTSSAFPSQTYSSANYWVDVVFQAAPPPTLSSIAVTPVNPTVLIGGAQQFVATGTYSDSSTQNLSSQVTWTSSKTAVATVNGSGLATGVSAGTTAISAALGSVSGSTTLTVQTPPTLTSIAVTPANPTVLVGAGQQFTATGTYSDNSKQNLSSQVTWTSSKTAVASVNANGLATGLAAGTTTISAALSGVTGSTVLTVQTAPLAITTASLTNGTVNAAYSAALAASGGTLPYTWSIVSGGLPAGLTLNTTSGAITGTPTSAGVSNFTAQVSDASSPVQTATKALNISVSTSSPTPILILTNATSPFSQYYAEILSTEGFNEFVAQDIVTTTSATLGQYDVVILGQIALTPAQVTMLSNWVTAGGKLIAMRPDKQLAGLLGLVDAGSTLSQGYLLVNTASGPGEGIVGETIQFHGTADCYTLGNASSLATLYTNAQTSTVNPAVTVCNVGSNGGQAAAFTFDLARSVVYTRQGNPAWSGQERDGETPIRPDDLFYGAASSDPEPDWVDLTKVAIPQADEQQRLLANLMLYMEANRKLLPRFWYFPHGYKAVVVMTGDDHAGTYGGSYATTRFNQYLAASPQGGSVNDWTVPRCTAYIYVSPSPSLTSDAQAAAYNAAGFEIGVHLNTGCANYTGSSLDSFFTAQMSQFVAMFPSLPAQTTHRIHCIAWSDYSTPASVSRAHGIRLDTSYYYWPDTWILDRPGMFTGSGMPMRFASTNGAILDIYQATSQMTDESGQSYPYTIDTLLDRALGAEGYYGAFVANMHTDSYPDPDADAVFLSATNRGVPIISSRQLLTWLDARNASSIRSVNWVNNGETFSIQANANAQGLQVMVPVPAGYAASAVTYNGGSIAYQPTWVKGLQYASFQALTGNYQITYALDTTPPTVTSTQPVGGATGISPVTQIVASFSKVMNSSTINTSTVGLQDSLNNAVAATVSYNPSTFTATLTPSAPLGLSTSYTAEVKGGAGGVTDAAGNTLASDLVWTFTTTNVYSIWSSTAVPGLADGGADSAVELGVKFRSDVAGSISGIRFYKSSANTGTHVGNLWSSTGTKLASVTFTGETASGWQQMNFTTPVAITSNTVYVASYHSTIGHYSADANYFASAGVDSPPLHALANGVSGGDGVYIYGASSAFPTQTYNSANYWVDVVFKPAGP